MSHTYVALHYHLVFATKGRAPLITPEIQGELYRYVGGIVRGERGTLTEIGGVADHVHLLVGLRPRLGLSEMLRKIKGGSSHWLNEQPFCGETFAWQPGYAAFTVSPSQLGAVRRYVQRQEEHHRGMTYAAEMDALVERHGAEALS